MWVRFVQGNTLLTDCYRLFLARLGGLPLFRLILFELPMECETGRNSAIYIYIAWALTIAGLRQQNNLPLQSEDVSFLSMIPARRSTKPDITQMMGPLSACIPLRLHVAPNLSMEFLMRDIDAQFSLMGSMKECVEQCAMKTLGNGGGLQNTLKQAVFEGSVGGEYA